MDQHWDPAPDSADVEAATARVIKSARTLSDADLRAPSPLPGWSRGHVLSHLVGNAEGLVNLLAWAATGVEHPQYANEQARAASIEARAGRSRDELIAELELAHRRFTDAVDAVPPANWDHEVLWMGGEPRPAMTILDARLRELEIHHLDLDAGYTASDWSSPLAFRILTSVVPAFERRQMVPVILLPTDVDATVTVSGGAGIEVRGKAHELATWLLGRDDGASLTWAGAPVLPKPPAWN